MKNLDGIVVTGPRARFYTCNEAYCSYSTLRDLLYQRLPRMSTIGLFYGTQSKKRTPAVGETRRQPTSYLGVEASKLMKLDSVEAHGASSAEPGSVDRAHQSGLSSMVLWVREDRSEGEFDYAGVR